MARYGRISLDVSCIVDMDDEEMMEEARQLVEDWACERIRRGRIVVEDAADATEGDIPEYLIESRAERIAEAGAV